MEGSVFIVVKVDTFHQTVQTRKSNLSVTTATKSDTSLSTVHRATVTRRERRRMHKEEEEEPWKSKEGQVLSK